MATNTYATIGGKPLLNPGELYRSAVANMTPIDFWQRANSYTCPRGKEPGSAWLLLKRKDLDDLSGGTSINKNSFHSLKWTEGDRKIMIPSLVMIRSSCMNRALAGDKDAAHLVEFRDKRQILKFSSINAQYNVRIPAPSATSGAGLFYTDSINGAFRWNWQTMVDDIWGNLPSGAAAGSAPTLPYTPDPPPTGFRFIGVSAWDALHVTLETIGCTTVYDPIADAFTYARLGTTQTSLSASLDKLTKRLLYDYDPGDDYNLGNAPETIRVFFHRRELYHGIEEDTPDADNWEMTPAVSKDYSTGLSGAASGSVMTVWDDLPALHDSTGSNTNSAALQTRADEIGANIANRIDNSEERFRRMFGGLVDTITTGSEVSEIRWRDYGDQTGLVTEIIRKPADQQQVGRGTEAVAEHLAPPDFSRNSYPTYPRTDQLVQVDDGASSTGADLTANGDGLFDGYVVRFAGSAYETLEACWIRPSDLEGTDESAVSQLKQKDRLIGRLYGSETSGGTTLPLYLVRKGATSTSTGDTVKVVEITESDGTLFANCYSDETRQASDCVFRGRLFTRDADTQDLCDRSDVTDGADIWIKVDHSPWCEDMAKMLIGQRFLARKLSDSYTIGENDFPLYEACMEDSRLWSVQPSTDWSGAKTGTIFTIDTVDTTALSPTIQDYWGLWDNVINDGNNNGFGLLIGDDFIPVAMNRRAERFKSAVAVAHLTAETTTQICTVGTVISEAPFTSDPSISAVNNGRRLAAPTGTTCWFRRDPQSVTDYELEAVARSSPMIVEIKGSPDGDGEASQLSGSTALCVWDGRLTTPASTSGNLCSGGGTLVSEEDVWFGFTGPTSGQAPYFLSAGQTVLAYDTAQSFTPTGLAARRLYLAPRDAETYYGKAYENWTDGGSNDDYVRVRPYSPQDDITATAQTQTVYLLKNAERDPNVVTDDIVAYRLGMDGRWVAVSDYLDDKIGTVKMWALSSGNIPPGWAIMDGSANASGNGGSGIDMTNRFVKGGTNVGQRGGQQFHIHPLYVIVEAHGEAEVQAAMGAHRHSIDTDSISISDHEVADLEHRHVISTTAANQWQDDVAGDVNERNVCTGLPVIDDVTQCDGGAWGPLTHTIDSGSYTGEVDPSYANFSAMVHVASNSYMDPAEHEPLNVTLIFIERIDNSV